MARCSCPTAEIVPGAEGPLPPAPSPASRREGENCITAGCPPSCRGWGVHPLPRSLREGVDEPKRGRGRATARSRDGTVPPCPLFPITYSLFPAVPAVPHFTGCAWNPFRSMLPHALLPRRKFQIPFKRHTTVSCRKPRFSAKAHATSSTRSLKLS